MIVKFLSVPVVFFIVITIATLAVCLVIIVVVGETIVKISDHRNKIHRKSLIDQLRHR
jgi:hypothetical protein